jgi:DNA polymerase-3 subunit delta'
MRGLQHPDFRWVRRDADADNDDALGAEAADGASGLSADAGGQGGDGDGAAPADAKKKSQQIRIEQIRGLAGFANVGSHRGGLRVVVLSPANRMNDAAANALLKTLEEPPESLMFILVADSLRGIPATIVSRCRRIDLSVDDATLARLQAQESQAAEWLLPLLAAGEVDPIRWAEKAGKSPPADALELLMRWMSDAARVAHGVAPRSFPDQAPALSRQSLRIRSPQAWAQTMAELQRIRGVAEHPLNPKLFYESIFDRYRRALA